MTGPGSRSRRSLAPRTSPCTAFRNR
jgi:hypothetical protein